jgi:hypothetical protein
VSDRFPGSARWTHAASGIADGIETGRFRRPEFRGFQLVPPGVTDINAWPVPIPSTRRKTAYSSTQGRASSETDDAAGTS